MSRGGLRLYLQDGSFSGFYPQAVTVARQRPIFTALSGDQPIKVRLFISVLYKHQSEMEKTFLYRSLSDLNSEHCHVVVLRGVANKTKDIGFDVIE